MDEQWQLWIHEILGAEAEVFQTQEEQAHVKTHCAFSLSRILETDPWATEEVVEENSHPPFHLVTAGTQGAQLSKFGWLAPILLLLNW